MCLGTKVFFSVLTSFIKELPAAHSFVSLFVFYLNFKQVVFMFWWPILLQLQPGSILWVILQSSTEFTFYDF